MAIDLKTLPEEEQARLRGLSDNVLRYIAPMLCGEKERAELIRRMEENAK